MSKLDEIADYAQHHDFAAEMDQCTWETGTETDPMVTTSVRLPKSLLDWVRQRAAAAMDRAVPRRCLGRGRGKPRRPGRAPRTRRLPRHEGIVSRSALQSGPRLP